MTDTEIDPTELHFLILHYLAAGPCHDAARTLEQQAVANGLLPCRHDIFGNQHRLGYSDLQHKYAHIAAEALPNLLQHALTARRASTALNLKGDCSLLTSGAQHGQVDAPRHPVKLQDLSLCQKQSLRQQGHFGSRGRIASTQEQVQQIQHHKTIRGHKLAVYCIAFDRVGRHIITGSDDRLVKIWSVQTALLLRSCRGHDGEVTDLAIHLDSTMVASSSNDTTIRCWSLEGDKLGHPVSVLVGHQGPVTYVDFNRTIPNALLSSSFDGTCRIWDATNSAWPAKVMRACPLFGPMKGITRFGGTAGPFSAGQGSKPNTRSLEASVNARVAVPEATAAAMEHSLRSHDPMEVAPSSGAAAATTHQEQSVDQTGLLVCGFSPDGSHIVAGSNDCHIYAWFWDIASAADKGKAAAKQGFYNVVSEEDAGRNLAPAAAVDLEAGDWPEPQETCRLGGHVNDVLLLQFSHDGHSIATGSKDGTMRIWQRMRRRNKLLNNWENKHALKCELDDAVVRKAKQKRRAPPVPSVNQLAWSHDDMLVISSVSDHTIRVWDTHTGVEVQRLVGHEAQVHILECHPVDHRLAMSASYDGTTRLWNLYTGQALASFSTKDTRPDVHGSWTDHIQLVDGHWSPDGSSLVVSDVAGQWHMYSVGAPVMVKHAKYDQFLESDYDRLTRDVNNAVIDDNTQQPPHLRPTRDYLVDYVAGRYAEPYQSAYRSDQVLQLPLKLAQGEGEWDTLGLPQALREYPPTVTAAGWMAQEAEGSDEDIDRAIQRAMQRAIAAEAALAAAVVAGEVDLIAVDNDQEGEQVQVAEIETQAEGTGGSSVGVGTRRSAPLRTDDDDDAEDNMEEAEEWEQWQDGDVDISSSDGNAAGSDSDDSMYSEGAGGARTRAQRRGRRADKRPRPSPDRRGHRARKRQRLQRSQYAEDASDEEEELEEEYEAQDGQRLLRSHRTRTRCSDAKYKKQKKKKVRRQTGRAQAGAVAQGGRQLDKYAWLQVSWRTPGVYVPQLGDEVVYLQVGHRKFLSHNNNKLQGPWDSIVSTLAETRGQRMREVEPARVIALDYMISDDGTSNTCAKVRLQLSQPGSPHQGRTFDIQLPPPNCGHAEFVVPKHRFLASVHRKWKVGDCCQVFYPDEDSEAAATCEAWHGDVTGVTSHDQAGDGEEVVQADPYGCGGLWERFLVGWQPRPQTGHAHNDSDEDDNTEPTHQSPWELFDEGLDAQQAVQEGPALDSPVTDRLKHAVQALSASEHFELFVDLLDPDAAYPASDTGALMYYNTMVALPMSLSLIKDRLEQGYYRQVQGVMGDVATIQGNAQAFNGEDSQVAEMAADLARRLHAAAEGGSYEDGLASDDAQISDLDQAAAQGDHPSEQPVDDHGQKGGEEDAEDEEEEEDIDIMNSPLERPWETDVKRLQRSNRSRSCFGSPIPSDGTAVLREGPLPHPSPSSRRQLRRHTRADAAARDDAGPSSWTGHPAAQANADNQNGHQAAVRQTRSQARGKVEARPTGAEERHDTDESGHLGNDAANPMLREQRHQSPGRSMRSRRVKSQEPSSSFQVNTEGDARLASEWQEAYDKEQSESRVRCSRRSHAQPSSQPAKSEEAAGEAAGPNQPAASLSPVSTRETRAQIRSLRGQQAEDDPSETGLEAPHRLLGRQQLHVRDVSPETAAAAAAGPAEGHNYAVRRSSRAHVKAAPASLGVDVDKADGATQGSTGIRVTLRPSSETHSRLKTLLCRASAKSHSSKHYWRKTQAGLAPCKKKAAQRVGGDQQLRPGLSYILTLQRQAGWAINLQAACQMNRLASPTICYHFPPNSSQGFLSYRWEEVKLYRNGVDTYLVDGGLPLIPSSVCWCYAFLSPQRQCL
ncbi:hypothetical protein WJX77_011758 [Trebouxia sp. C0004]